MDDDLPFRRSLAISLRLEGIDVLEAGTRAEALGALAANPICLALVNPYLAAEPGTGLLEQLVSAGPDVQVVALASGPEHCSALAATRRERRLVKPIAPAQILELLAS